MVVVVVRSYSIRGAWGTTGRKDLKDQANKRLASDEHPVF